MPVSEIRGSQLSCGYISAVDITNIHLSSARKCFQSKSKPVCVLLNSADTERATYMRHRDSPCALSYDCSKLKVGVSGDRHAIHLAKEADIAGSGSGRF